MNTNHSLATTVFITLGAASVCWENKEALNIAGVFDSRHAQSLGHQLLKAIDAYASEVNAEAAKDIKDLQEQVVDLQEQLNKLRRDENKLSSSYVRIRSAVRALTPPATMQQDITVMHTYVEERVKTLVAIGAQFANLGFNLHNYKPAEITQAHLNSLASLTDSWDREFK